MPLYNTKPVFLILIPFLMMHHNSKSSFEFPNFSGAYRNDIIIYQGDAFASSKGTTRLTKTKNDTNMPHSSGRASYALPVRLWDTTSNMLASFTTTFSFVVTTTKEPVLGNIGDGITFFIAPYHSDIPESSDGGYLGLFSPDTALTASRNKIVAVEFDTFPNKWDPPFAHVGIDVNSIGSLTMVRWGNENIDSDLTTVFATVTYEPFAHNLSVVVVSYPESKGKGTTISLSHVVDLRTVLPEWVSVGFSGATGRLVEEHQILSWAFSSSLY